MRPIDADAFSEQYGNYYSEEGSEEGFIGTVGELIAKQPTVEAEPVRHGRWKWEKGYVGTMAVCSVCGSSPRSFYSLPKNQIGRLPIYKYCPRCGARMDGGAENVN